MSAFKEVWRESYLLFTLLYGELRPRTVGLTVPLERRELGLEYCREAHFCFCEYRAAAAKSLQSCPTLWDPRDGSPPDSPVLGILQARTLEWVAISFSNAWKWKVKVKSFSHVRLFETPWTAAYQAPPSMGFFRQEYWSGVPLPSPVLTRVYRTWGDSWRVLSKAGIQMIL